MACGFALSTFIVIDLWISYIGFEASLENFKGAGQTYQRALSLAKTSNEKNAFMNAYERILSSD